MKRILDWLYQLFQPRRLGADWQDDENDYTIDSVGDSELLGEGLPSGDKFVRIKNQGRTNRCTAYGLSYLVETMLASHAHKYKKGWSRVYIDEDELWANQVRRASIKSGRSRIEMERIMERGGDYLHNALGSLIENGAHFYRQIGMTKKKYHVTFEKYVRIDKEGSRKLPSLAIMDNVKKAFASGHPVYTGARLGNPWYNGPEWNIVRNAVGGHAFCATDITQSYLFGPNTWGKKWGESGYWYAHGSKAKDLFGMYILIGIKVREITD